jgi:hypothetical protein
MGVCAGPGVARNRKWRLISVCASAGRAAAWSKQQHRSNINCSVGIIIIVCIKLFMFSNSVNKPCALLFARGAWCDKQTFLNARRSRLQDSA